MGTRSLTKVIQTWKDKSDKKQRQTITCMYRQMDGYLEGHGQELAEWLSGYTIVNGIPLDRSEPMFNGMDCLAAQMFVHFKADGCKDDGTPVSSPGGIYCMHPDSEGCGEEYLYEIENGIIDEKETIFITVYEKPPRGYDGWVELFHGIPKEFLTKIEKYVED